MWRRPATSVWFIIHSHIDTQYTYATLIFLEVPKLRWYILTIKNILISTHRFNDLRTTISHIAARVECCNQIAEKTMPSQDTSYMLCGIIQTIHRYIYQRPWPGKLRTHPHILTGFHKTTRIRRLHQCSLCLCKTSLRAWLCSWHIYHQVNLHIHRCQFALPFLYVLTTIVLTHNRQCQFAHIHRHIYVLTTIVLTYNRQCQFAHIHRDIWPIRYHPSSLLHLS